MYDPDGQPLPPTKQQETSASERAARRAAIVAQDRGVVRHSLLKVEVLLESRSAVWKRIGPLTAAQHRPVAAVLDAASLDPWKATLPYDELDAQCPHETEDGQPRRVRRTYEMARSRRVGQCDHCHGRRVDVCSRCKGAAPDECWWCMGKGKKGGRRCAQCAGAGVMACRACTGSQTMPCGPCQGEGTAQFAAFVHVTLARLALDPLPLGEVMRGQRDGDEERACISRTRTMVAALVERTSATRIHRPRRVFCTLAHSTSHLVEVQTPKQARVVTGKAGPRLQPSSRFQRSIRHSSFYFALPSDPVLPSVELSEAEFKASLQVAEGKERSSTHHTLAPPIGSKACLARALPTSPLSMPAHLLAE